MANQFSFRVISMLCFAMLLTGCAGVTRTALSPQVASNIASVNSKLSIPADEVIVRAKPSNISAAMGYGLIPALIDGSISASRQSELEVLSSAFYAKVDQIDFRSTFGNAFRTSIDKQKSLSNLKISTSTKGLSRTTVDAYKSDLKADEAFLGIRIWYEFSPDLRNIVIAADTQLSTKSASEPVYKNSFVYISAPVDNANPLAAWALNDGEALSKIFAESGDEIAKMMQQDLSGPANDILFANLATNEKIQYKPPFFIPMQINGFITDKAEHRQVIRADSGVIYSIPR